MFSVDQHAAEATARDAIERDWENRASTIAALPYLRNATSVSLNCRFHNIRIGQKPHRFPSDNPEIRGECTAVEG
jgi:hypothetical protein